MRVRDEYRARREVTDAVERKVTRITTTDAPEVKIDIAFPRGLVLQTQPKRPERLS